MIKLEIGNSTVDIKNDSTDLVLDDIQKISNLAASDTSFLITWYNIFKIISDSDQFIYLSDNDFLDIVKKINLGKYSEDYVKEIFIDDKKYVLDLEDGQPKINMKIMLDLEKYITNDSKNWLKYAIALFYKEEDATLDYHFNEKNIEKRAELFNKELSGDVCFPLMWFVNKKMNQNFTKMKDILANG